MFRLIFLFFCFPLVAENPWFPGLEEPFPIRPALPKNFVIGSLKPEADVHQGIYWGTKEGIRKLINHELPLNSPVIAVKLTANVKQTGPKSFDGDGAMKRELRMIGRSKLKIEKIDWGNYPVLTLKGVSQQGIHYILAFVGLNREDGKTLMFTFLTPAENNKPSEEELALWKRFLEESQG